MVEICRHYKDGCSLIVPNARLSKTAINGYIYSTPLNCGFSTDKKVVCGFYAAYKNTEML